ncbi:MAG: hypothetical protein GXY01_06800 [Clostridiales bacterium]|jgi:transcription initiation factor IIE alpha subunit|nr:hypothetical protein [Clostridiales bacterium]
MFISRLQETMAGRNGLDKLSITLIILSVILNAFTRFSPIFMMFALLIMFYAIWRIFSKNLAKRREENYRFTHIAGDIKESFAQWQYRRQQSKQYKFFTCPDCRSRLRLPRGKGKINITCPKCGQKFRGKT